jgi:hypothetical protein
MREEPNSTNQQASLMRYSSVTWGRCGNYPSPQPCPARREGGPLRISQLQGTSACVAIDCLSRRIVAEDQDVSSYKWGRSVGSLQARGSCRSGT